jgi:restriction endonuclease Mrr
MKVQGTTAGATDLLYEIQECVSLSSVDKSPTFRTDLQALLVTNVLTEIQTGRMDSYGFENLIKDVLLSLGAVECYVVPRNSDKGADLMAVFRVAGAFQQRIAVQAKHWRPHPPVDSSVVEQLIRGIEAEGADLGMVITSGTISDEAVLRAQQYFEEQGKRIELIDGEQFAKLIVENGFSKA